MAGWSSISLWAQAQPTAYRLYARSVCDMNSAATAAVRGMWRLLVFTLYAIAFDSWSWYGVAGIHDNLYISFSNSVQMLFKLLLFHAPTTFWSSWFQRFR